MPARKRLTDLYVVGKPMTIEDPSDPDNPIEVYVRKLSPTDQEKAVRAANAKRALILSYKKLDEAHSDREDYLTQVELSYPTNEARVDYLVMTELARQQSIREDELAARDEWDKDGYLQGLRVLWEEEKLKDVWTTTPEADHESSAEWKEADRVHDALQKFTDALDEVMAVEEKRLRKEIGSKTDRKLLQNTVDKLIDNAGNMAWINEFRKQEILYGVREPDNHKAFYFVDRAEVDELENNILVQLIVFYQQLNVDIIEGKD